MPDAQPTPAAPAAPIAPVTPGANDPQQPGSGGPGAFDPKTIGDADLPRVLEDPRLWNQPRLKELRDASAELKTLKAEKEAADKAALEKKGEWETVAKNAQEKARQAEERYAQAITDNAILAEAAKQGITDLDAAKKLIDRSKITIDEQGQAQGVAEAVATLVKDKAYLVGTPAQPSVGSPTAPVTPPGTGQFKLSQLQDPVFYQANFEAIARAMTTPGGIVDDVHQ